MAIFFTDNEVITIMTIILLFDLNSFCDITLTNFTLLTFFIGLFVILFDSYVLHRLVNDKNQIDKMIYTFITIVLLGLIVIGKNNYLVKSLLLLGIFLYLYMLSR